MRNTDAFRERFKYWKTTGELPYEAGLPKYGSGKPSRSAFVESLNGKNKQTVNDVIDYFLSAGVNPMLISGIVGNMAQESRFDPNVSNGAQSKGLAQMSNDMRKEVKRVYGNTDWQSQVRFIHDAMSGDERISKPWRSYMKQHGGYYGNTYATPQEAAMAFGRVFERPNEKLANWEQRTSSAYDAYNYIVERSKDQKYDMKRAIDLGYTRDEQGHMPSRDVETGRILKTPTHPTMFKTIINDASIGYYPKVEQDGWIYTRTWPGNDVIQSYITDLQDDKLEKPTFIITQ